MKPRLLFADQDRDFPDPAPETRDVVRDLGLAPILDTMASGDTYLHDVAERVLLAAPLTPEQVRYRQDILDDCLSLPGATRELYELAGTAIEAKRRVHAWIPSNHPGSILRAAVAILRDLTDYLHRLHTFAEDHRQAVHSRGLTTLLDTIRDDLDDTYLTQVRDYISQLEFPHGVVLTARLGPGATGVNYSLREAAPMPWWSKVADLMPLSRGYTYHLPPHDENGGITLERIAGHGINTVANAAAQSADHVLSFFHRLHFEIGFYLACLNLHQALHDIGTPTCRPGIAVSGPPVLTARNLTDTGLALRTRHVPVGSDLDADGKALIMLTGANQGGKSTLLRAIGLAQLMLDAGMFVTADTLGASTSTGVFTHYRREEDTGLKHGKLDDELVRISNLIDHLTPGALLLLDESFASTNEREGSQIATDIVEALLQAGVRVCYVTHLYTLSHGLANRHDPRHLFLRATRGPDGNRTYHLTPAEPESTSYAIDQFRQVFAEPLADRAGEGSARSHRA